MPSAPNRSRYPQPNVLADGVEPNRLSTQAGFGAAGSGGPPARPRTAMPANRLAPGAPARRSTGAPAGDARFEPRTRRTPSLATVIVLGFLLVTVFRVIVSLVGH